VQSGRDAQQLQEGLESSGCLIAQSITYQSDIKHSLSLHKPDLIMAAITSSSDKAYLEPLSELDPIDCPPVILIADAIPSDIRPLVGGVQACMVFSRPARYADLAANARLLLTYKSRKHRAFANIFNGMEAFDLTQFQRRIGSAIKLVRKEKQLTQALAAEKMNVNYRHYQDIESGKINLKIDTLFKIFKGLS
jgi:DNA-binding XRE family transcriptional regulator